MAKLKYDPRKDWEDILNDVTKYVREVEEERDSAKKQLTEWNKDKEVAALKKELQDAQEKILKGFNPDVAKWEEIRQWQEKHKKEKHTSKRNYTSEFEYRFSEEGFGKVGHVTCLVCERLAISKSQGSYDKYKEYMDRYGAEHSVGVLEGKFFCK